MSGPGNTTPRQLEESEERRPERRQGAHDPNAPQVSEGARTVVAVIMALVLVGLIVYAILGWAGVIPIPGITAD